MLYNKDCVDGLKFIEKESVDLIYLDPPFFTQKKRRQKTRDNSKEYAFDDSWASIDIYKDFIKARLVVCREMLKNTGSIFLHCDKAASHYLRVALDEVFGYENFQSEIIWTYKRWSNAKKGLLNAHQIIFFYSKTKKFKFYQQFQDYSLTTNIDQIFQERVRNEHGKSSYKKDGKKYVLLEKKQGVPLSDVWEIPYLNPKAKERVGYPTQKPILLLEKIIGLACDENDVVLDPFCGSGTTLVAAKLMRRKYIGFDTLKEAIALSKKRLKAPVRTDSTLLKKGRGAYKNQRKDISDYLESLNAYPVQRNRGIDGFVKVNGDIRPIPIKVQRENEGLEEAKNLLIRACEKNQYEKKVLISTEVVRERQDKRKNVFIFSKKKINVSRLTELFQ